jgi:hypothetical protein
MGPFPGINNTIGLAAEDAIPRQVIQEVLPQLEAMFVTLSKLQRVWNVPQNGIPAKIIAAAQAGQPLGGYDPADWARWGQTLLALNVFLATPITITLPDGSTENVTPESVLLTRYTPMQQQP